MARKNKAQLIDEGYNGIDARDLLLIKLISRGASSEQAGKKFTDADGKKCPLATKTVENRLLAVRNKVQATHNAHLVFECIRRGLIDFS